MPGRVLSVGHFFSPPDLRSFVRAFLFPSVAKIGSVLGLVCLTILAGCFSSEPLEEETEQFFPLPPNGSIAIENGDGAVRIVGWSDRRVRLEVVRRAYTAARLKQIRFITKADSNMLRVRTEVLPARGLFADRSGTVEYTLDVPETSHLTLRLKNGEISVQGLREGTAKLELVNGRLTLLNTFATVDARVTNGVVECFFDRRENLPAAINFLLGQGRIGVRLPVNTGFRVNAQTGQGHIGNGFGLKPSANGAGQTLTGVVSQPSVSLGLRTRSGNITIDAIR
jgi:DUF4097 and DUF4098 domain-containing protein YvlB